MNTSRSRLSTPIKYLGDYTWAGLPAASSGNSGWMARATDVGISPGMCVVSDGTRWIPDGVQVLARSAVVVTAPLDTSENILATITVPANAMGINGGVRLSFAVSPVNNANAKTLRVRFSGIAGTELFSRSIASSGGTSGAMLQIANRGAANSQHTEWAAAHLGGGATANQGSVLTSAIDTTAATTVVVTVQKATGSDAITLEYYCAELLP